MLRTAFELMLSRAEVCLHDRALESEFPEFQATDKFTITSVTCNSTVDLEHVLTGAASYDVDIRDLKLSNDSVGVI